MLTSPVTSLLVDLKKETKSNLELICLVEQIIIDPSNYMQYRSKDGLLYLKKSNYSCQ